MIQLCGTKKTPKSKNWVNVHPRFLKNEMRREMMYTLYANNKVLKMTMRLKCVPGVSSFVSGDDSDQIGSFVSKAATIIGKHIYAQTYCQYRTRCCTAKFMSPPSYSKLSLVKIHQLFFLKLTKIYQTVI